MLKEIGPIKMKLMETMYPVVHFEMPAEDRKRMAEFYSKAFGWKATFFGKEMGNYVTVATSETDEHGMPEEPGTINGGFYPKGENSRSNCPSLVIAVDDVNEHVKIVKKSGGEILGEPVNIPGIGLYVSFRDPEGNVCSMLQAVMPEGEEIAIEEIEGV
jgi:predicted enzyme related to lactoylglutathione lyase